MTEVDAATQAMPEVSPARPEQARTPDPAASRPMAPPAPRGTGSKAAPSAGPTPPAAPSKPGTPAGPGSAAGTPSPTRPAASTGKASATAGAKGGGHKPGGPATGAPTTGKPGARKPGTGAAAAGRTAAGAGAAGAARQPGAGAAGAGAAGAARQPGAGAAGAGAAAAGAAGAAGTAATAAGAAAAGAAAKAAAPASGRTTNPKAAADDRAATSTAAPRPPATQPGDSQTRPSKGKPGTTAPGSKGPGDRQPQRPAGAPQTWQGLVSLITGGRLRPRLSDEQRARLQARIAAPVGRSRRIAMIALKGGVGKTTTTACLGAVLAEHRQDRIVAVDANPDAGTLGYRIRLETTRTARDLLADVTDVEGYADMRAHASQTSFRRLEVIASDVDPTVDQAFGEEDYRDIAAVLERFYGIVLTDCGPGLLHSAMRSILPSADELVVISAASLDGSRAASLTLDWLEQHEYAELARNAVVVINAVRPRSQVDVDQLERHFARRCRTVVLVPFDRHLETGSEIVFQQLAPATRHAYLELAAAVVDGIAGERA